MRVLFVYFSYLEPCILELGMLFGEDQRQTLQRHMSKRDWTTSSSCINYSTLNSEHSWENLCNHFRKQQTCAFDKHTKSRGGLVFLSFIVDLLIQHKFHCVYLINRRWRTKTNRITPTYLN